MSEREKERKVDRERERERESERVRERESRGYLIRLLAILFWSQILK